MDTPQGCCSRFLLRTWQWHGWRRSWASGTVSSTLCSHSPSDGISHSCCRWTSVSGHLIGSNRHVFRAKSYVKRQNFQHHLHIIYKVHTDSDVRRSYRSICPFCPLDTHNYKYYPWNRPHSPCPQDRGCSHTGCSRWDICHLNANTSTLTQLQLDVCLRFSRSLQGVINLPSHWQVAVLRCRGVTKLRRAVL